MLSKLAWFTNQIRNVNSVKQSWVGLFQKVKGGVSKSSVEEDSFFTLNGVGHFLLSPPPVSLVREVSLFS